MKQVLRVETMLDHTMANTVNEVLSEFEDEKSLCVLPRAWNHGTGYQVAAWRIIVYFAFSFYRIGVCSQGCPT